ncbi:hypothetical protein DY000_02010143 [Brassica cretica]|uniref:PPM-type phosphatase domain-containing protein n=1 Tax=Brassica cretica TaxID=69181 RepID=A0ABQ7C612_BRACR|nr:hypothetical protein DY000_02010143 [Brassica cretica]
MHLIRERYRSFQPLLIDEMMQGQRGWRELAFLGDKVSCYKPDAWALTCVAVIRHKQLVVSNDAYNLSRDHKPDLEAEKERILLKAGGFIHAG